MAPRPTSFAAGLHPRSRTSWWWPRSPMGLRRARPTAIDALNANDLVIVQHEYGLYDGPDGEALIDLVDALEVPIVVVAHTVLTEPTPNQRRVLERVCAAADAVVVMTETAKARLFAGFDVDHATRRRGPARSGDTGRWPPDRPTGDARSSEAPDVGPVGAWQGHRVGDRRARRTWTTSTRCRST